MEWACTLVSGVSDSACDLHTLREQGKLLCGYTVSAEECICRRESRELVCWSVYRDLN